MVPLFGRVMRALKSVCGECKFNDNVKGARLKAAATNSKPTSTAARFDEPEPAATKANTEIPGTA
jgi:hypothetical protein